MFDELGQRLHLLASVLTDDGELAGRLVVEAVLAHPEPSGLHDLSAGVYLAWVEGGESSCTTGAVDSPSTDVVQQIHTLPADHRAALGLCKYGGHDYRRAAALLGLTPERVAQMLCEALRSLGTARAVDVGPSSAA